MITRVDQVLRQVRDDLAAAGIDSPAAEATIIMTHVMNVTRGELGVQQVMGTELEPATVEAILDLTRQRATRIPLQYLTGTAGFYGLDIAVEPGVFIPRVETEILVETTLDHFAHDTGPLNILDLCTGTGAIAAALADQFAQRGITAQLWAVDIEAQAVELARQNCHQHNVTVLCADATDYPSVIASAPELADLVGSFDAVVTNPPYIPTKTPVTQREATYDPDTALYGGSSDGLAIPLQIAAQAHMWLAPGGFFIMEHDHSHARELADALRATGPWDNVTTLLDLTGTQRFVSALRPPHPQPTTD